MTVKNLRFSKNGVEDTGFESPRKGIAPERAEQQCSCYWCAFDCKPACDTSGAGGYASSTFRTSEEWGEFEG